MEDFQIIAETMMAVMKLMVDKPDELILTIIPDGAGATLRVAVARADAGMLIGKDGRIARSLRIILLAIGMKAKQKLALDITVRDA
jgi:predicted RNA-binding protein YlqC (UPF0109 family)